MVVPAGVKYANGKYTKTAMTNRELMEQGRAPFVKIKGGRGYSPVELHHTSMLETQRGYSFFNQEDRDGPICELPKYIHRGKGKSRVIHIKGRSFRVAISGGESYDSAKYKAFKKKYWKERIKEILLERGIE